MSFWCLFRLNFKDEGAISVLFFEIHKNTTYVVLKTLLKGTNISTNYLETANSVFCKHFLAEILQFIFFADRKMIVQIAARFFGPYLEQSVFNLQTFAGRNSVVHKAGPGSVIPGCRILVTRLNLVQILSRFSKSMKNSQNNFKKQVRQIWS